MPPSSQPTNTRPSDILPRIAYAYEHALNCYDHSATPERQPVRDAGDFAQFAVDALAYEPGEIEELLKEIEESKASGTSITVKSFLKIYRQFRNQMDHLTKEDAEEIFRDRRLAYRLKKKKICVQICDLILEDPDWFEQRLKPLVEARVASSSTNKQLAEEMLPVPRKQSSAVLNTLAGDQELADELKYRHFMSLFRYLQALSPVMSDPGTWVSLLEKLLSNEQTLQFILHHEELHILLVAIGTSVFSETDHKHVKLMRPLFTNRSVFIGGLTPAWGGARIRGLLDNLLEKIKK